MCFMVEGVKLVPGFSYNDRQKKPTDTVYVYKITNKGLMAFWKSEYQFEVVFSSLSGGGRSLNQCTCLLCQ